MLRIIIDENNKFSYEDTKKELRELADRLKERYSELNSHNIDSIVNMIKASRAYISAKGTIIFHVPSEEYVHINENYDGYLDTQYIVHCLGMDIAIDYPVQVTCWHFEEPKITVIKKDSYKEEVQKWFDNFD